MKILLIHPSALLYSEVYLRLEPLGLECVGAALLRAGHEVRLLDLQIFRQPHFEREIARFRPDAIGFSVNYLANVPEVIEKSLPHALHSKRGAPLLRRQS